MPWVLIIIIAVAILFLAMSIKIVRQSEVFLIERLGKFHKAASAGLTIIIPFVDHVRSVVSLKQQTLDIAPQKVITRDNVTITINTVVFYKIIDPKKAVYEVQNLKKGIEYLSVTSIRDLIGKMDLDSTFSSRDSLNDKLKSILDEASSPWGCSIDRVEIQDITLPPDIQDAMEKQMNAERNKRAAILQAEGERQAAVLKAQGEKDAAILHADANRESQIRRATGEAEAIRRVAEAKADEVKLVYGAMMKAHPSDKLVQLKSLETLGKVADGKGNKVFIPFEATKSLASLGAMKEVIKDDEATDAQVDNSTPSKPSDTDNDN
jgi:regulator of protease activity HflC (stomatin/prohibitin superfamily)